ncbi:MAG TPA: hypothetical protein VGN52_13300 [Burkholderiales bacterium]
MPQNEKPGSAHADKPGSGGNHPARVDDLRNTSNHTILAQAGSGPEAKPEARPAARPGSKAAEPEAAHEEKKRPSLSYAQPRTPLDRNPEDRARPEAITGNANLTNHDANDPALRRVPDGGAPEAGGRSGVSPLARDGATPQDEDQRRARDMHDADQRGRLKGIAPRADVEAWHQAEEARQGDLPGRPRKL